MSIFHKIFGFDDSPEDFVVEPDGSRTYGIRRIGRGGSRNRYNSNLGVTPNLPSRYKDTGNYWGQ